MSEIDDIRNQQIDNERLRGPMRIVPPKDAYGRTECEDCNGMFDFNAQNHVCGPMVTRLKSSLSKAEEDLKEKDSLLLLQEQEIRRLNKQVAGLMSGMSIPMIQSQMDKEREALSLAMEALENLLVFNKCNLRTRPCVVCEAKEALKKIKELMK